MYFYMEHFLSFAVLLLLFPSSSLYLHAKKAKKLRIADFDDAPVLRFPRPIIYRQREGCRRALFSAWPISQVSLFFSSQHRTPCLKPLHCNVDSFPPSHPLSEAEGLLTRELTRGGRRRRAKPPAAITDPHHSQCIFMCPNPNTYGLLF